ncbi:hypothetical protein C6500_11485 [Candidatus Poribacteria bacterium]|nr:MAG: hypothetical protein C6500_11485 [Candidatus Poribacteria bacterium]
MAQQYDNPFRNMTITSPITQREDYDHYCQAGQRAKAKTSPFPRKVDLWFAGLTLAAHKKLEPIDLQSKDTADIISGDIFNTDGWQAQAIMLIAIAVEGNLEVVLNPRQMMDIANGLAAAGVPHIVKMLNEGHRTPIWNLSDAFETLLRSDTITEEPSDHDRLAEALL